MNIALLQSLYNPKLPKMEKISYTYFELEFNTRFARFIDLDPDLGLAYETNLNPGPPGPDPDSTRGRP